MSIATKLLTWYDENGRDLPWRKVTDPYPILVSEIMLQQTQVARGILYFEKWLALFPDFESLAKATNAQVIEAWAGLGYNRRALALRDIARQVVERGVPESYEEWVALKGIGPYTASAISVFSLQTKRLPVDTNIRRVLGRVYLGVHFPDLSHDEQIISASEELLKSKRFHDIPQALFDLATMTCLKTPLCELCPLKESCKSSDDFLSGTITTPKRTIKKAVEKKHTGKKHPDRIYRGRILKLVREKGRVKTETIGPEIDETFNRAKDREWLTSMLDRLERDTMIEKQNNYYQLCSK